MYRELEQMQAALVEYIEGAYHITNEHLLERRRELLESNGVISQLPYIESTARYALGQKYEQLLLPDAVRGLFSHLASKAGGGILFNPPYSHQAEALESILGNSPQNLIVTTGTGSGKTETFLLPVLGRLAREAANNPDAFGERAMRALLLYPMNALVNDQLARLRLLFGARSTVGWFVEKAGRPAKFGRYTSRTPFPGVVPDDTARLRDRFRGLKFYSDLERKAKDGDPKVRRTIQLLKERGKWPVKVDTGGGEYGFSTWFGSGHWFDKNGQLKRAIERPLDPELITRFESQQAPPDLLVTNYSMLEYMMLRPIERSIFDRSKTYYADHPDEKFILVLDEAHLYRGAQGTEVAMLIRRLRSRLGLAPDRLQVICTSASFDAAVKAKSFAAGLSGTDENSFKSLTGQRIAVSPSAAGDDFVAELLASVSLFKLRTGRYSERVHALSDLMGLYRDALKEFTYQLRVPAEQQTDLPGCEIRVTGVKANGTTSDECVKVPVGGAVGTKCQFVAIVDIDSSLKCDVVRSDTAAGLHFDPKGGISVPRDSDPISRILFDILSAMPVLGRLLNLTSGAIQPDDPETGLGGGAAQEVSRLAKRLFPETSHDLALQATDSLIELASMAKAAPSAAPLMAARVHRFFRGLPGLWACSDRSCTELPKEKTGLSPVGKLHVQPVRTCACGAKVFELHTCRTCGAAYFHAWTLTPDSPNYLWNQDVGEIDDADAEVQPLQILLEDPSAYFDPSDQEAQRFVERYLDPVTGRVVESSGERTRPVWLPPIAANHEPGLFPKCPCCQKPGTEIMDLKTKGDEPFQQLIASQLLEQPPRSDVDTPLRGRKALIFSDGRQPASRLAGKLGDNSLRDSVRPLLLDGYEWFRELWGGISKVQSLRYAYAALLAGAYRNDVKLTPKLRGGEHSFYDHVATVNTLLKEKASWDSFADAAEAISLDCPRAIRLAIYEVLFNRQTGVHALALGALVPWLSEAQVNALNKLPDPPGAEGLTEDERRWNLLSLWIRLMADRRAVFLPGTPAQWIDTSEGAKLKLQQGGFATTLRPLLSPAFVRANFSTTNGNSGPWLTFLCTSIGCAHNAGNFLLNGAYVALTRADSLQWQRCSRCSWVQPISPIGAQSCPQCGGKNTIHSLDLGSQSSFRKRKGLYRRLTERLATSDRGTWAPHPFVAEEHTAAIGAVDSQQSFSRAEWYEMRFQDLEVDGPSNEPGGPVDVLSCTTTMEVGIDIGSLTAVALRNVPPNRANYQQRAGRAGRRGSSLSTVITYADQGSHDQKFFTNPAAMISGPVTDPLLNLDNPDIVVRHGYAFILGQFQQARITETWANSRDRANIFASLGWVDDFRRGTAAEFSYRGLEQWIEDNMEQLQTALLDLMPKEFTSSHEDRMKGLPQELLTRLRECDAGPLDAADPSPGSETESTSGAFDKDWSDFDSAPSDESQQSPEASIAAESAEAARDTNKLLDRLFEKALLPSYAFPTDVVSMTVFDRKHSNEYKAMVKYAPQRGLSQALSSYAPGREVFIDGLRHYSFAVYSPIQSDRTDAWKRRQLYYECSQCGYVEVRDKDEPGRFVGELLNCPACRAMKDFGPAIYWMTPPGFAHPYDLDEDLAIEDPPDLTRPTHAKLTAEFQQAESPDEHYHVGKRGFLKWARKEELFITNAGSKATLNPGFRYCTFCGRIEPNGWIGGKAQLSSSTHAKPFPDHRGRDGKEVCLHRAAVKTVTLGTRFRSDVALYRLTFGDEVRLRPGSALARIALGTLANAMSAAVVRQLEIERSNVGGEYRPALSTGGATGEEVDIYLYDTASGGAGFVQAATQDAMAFLRQTLALLDDCDCTHSCYKCLHNYENRYFHADLDRKLAAAVLRHVLSLQERPTLESDTEDRLLASLARDLEDSGHKNAVLGDGYIDLPDLGNRRVVLANSLNPSFPSSPRAEVAFAQASNRLILPHLLVERALPLAVNRVLGIAASTDDIANKVPSFAQVVEVGGVPVYSLRQLSEGWSNIEPLYRIRVDQLNRPAAFLLLLEEPLLERYPIRNKTGQTVGRMVPGTLLVMQRLEAKPPTAEMSRLMAIVRHQKEMFRATRTQVTLGSLQWRNDRVRIGYISDRQHCKPEILATESLEVLAVLRGVYHQGELIQVANQKDQDSSEEG